MEIKTASRIVWVKNKFSLLSTVAMNVFLMIIVAGCYGNNRSGIFVSQFESEVDMLNVIEAPAGHLSGTLTASSINSEGNEEKKSYNISGSVYKDGLSLQLLGTNVVGTMSSNEVKISINGGETETFKKMTNQEYAVALTLLDKKVNEIQNGKLIIKSESDFFTYIYNLQKDLNTFLEWGNERISRESRVNNWYAVRISQYQKCVESVQHLAALHVPSWKWQECVINMDNDKFHRDQLIENIKQIQNDDIKFEDDLDSKIKSIPQHLSNVIDVFDKTCSISNIESCDERLNILKDEAKPPALNALIEKYKSTTLKVHNVIANDTETKDNGERELSALLREADDIYHNAINASN